MKTLLFLAGLMIAGTANTQNVFLKSFDGTTQDYGHHVQQTADGGYIVTGVTASFGAGNGDACLIKTDASGNTIWTKTYGGTGTERGMSVQQTTDGGYIITGYTNSFGSGQNDVYLIKTDAGGDTLWTKTYGGILSDGANSVQQCTDGGYIITGYTRSFGAGNQDVYLIKTDANGDTLWTKTYGGAGQEAGTWVQQCTDGGYIITGITTSFGAGNQDVYLIKTDASGDTLWTRTFGGTDDEFCWSVQQCTDGGYVVVGRTQSFVAGSDDCYLIKTDANGDTLWTKRYGGTGSQRVWDAQSVQQCTDGGYIITGTVGRWGWPGYWDIFLIKTDTVGDTLWVKKYGRQGEDDFGFSVQQCADGGYVITGAIDTSAMGIPRNIYIIKTDSLGNSSCNVNNTAPYVSGTATIVGSGGTIGSGGVVGHALFVVGNTLIGQIDPCIPSVIEQHMQASKYITIYPNPTTGKFKVEGSKFGVKTIEIYDLYGRLVLRTNEPEIDMSNYPAGLYIWSVGEARGKVVIE